MNVSINILFVAHPGHNMPQLLGRKFFRQFFYLPLTGLQSSKDKGNVPTSTNISKNKAQEKKSQQKSLGKRKEKGQQAVLDLSSFCDGQPTSLQNPDMRLGQAQNDETNSSSTQKTKTNRTKLCGRSKKRKRDVDGQSEEESRSAAKVKKAKPNEKPRRQKLDPGNDTDKDTWTETEKDRFHGSVDKHMNILLNTYCYL